MAAIMMRLQLELISYQNRRPKEANHPGCLRLVDSLATCFPVGGSHIVILLRLIPTDEKEDTPQLRMGKRWVLF